MWKYLDQLGLLDEMDYKRLLMWYVYNPLQSGMQELARKSSTTCRGTGKGVDAGTLAVYLHKVKGSKGFRVFGIDMSVEALQYAPKIFKALVDAELVPPTVLSCARANAYRIYSFVGIRLSGNWGATRARC